MTRRDALPALPKGVTFDHLCRYFTDSTDCEPFYAGEFDFPNRASTAIHELAERLGVILCTLPSDEPPIAGPDGHRWRVALGFVAGTRITLFARLSGALSAPRR